MTKYLESVDNLNFDCKKRHIGQNMQKFSANMFNILRKFLRILSQSPLFSLRNLNCPQTLVSIICALSMLITTMAVAKTHTKTQQEESLDHIVATVNDEIITQSELNQAIQNARMQMTQNQMAVPAEKTLKAQALQQLIDRKLQLQLAKQAGVTISNAELESVLNNIAKNNDITLKEMYAKIKAEGLSVENYKSNIHDELVIQKLEQQEIASRITVTPQEIREFMRTQHKSLPITASTDVNISYHLEDILIPLTETATPEETSKIQKLADFVLNELRHGKTPHDLSVTAPTIASNDLGWLKLDELPSAFTQYVSTMKIHDVAGPIKTGNGLHIIQLADIRNGGDETAISKEQAQQMVFKKKMGEALENWMSKLRSQAFIVTPD